MNRIVFAVLEILAAGVFLLPVYWLRFRDLRKCWGYCLFCCYLVAVYSLTGLPTVLYSRFQLRLNLIPFAAILSDGILSVLNVALFMPLGFLLPALWEGYRSAGRTVRFGLGLSLFVELAQIFTLRATDVNDLITNTLGAWLGWLLWSALKKPLPILRRTPKTTARELPRACLTVALVMFFLQPPLAAALWEIFAG